MAKNETTDQNQEQQDQQQDASAPAAERAGNDTVDTNAGDDAVMGTVADQPDGTEDDKKDDK